MRQHKSGSFIIILWFRCWLLLPPLLLWFPLWVLSVKKGGDGYKFPKEGKDDVVEGRDAVVCKFKGVVKALLLLLVELVVVGCGCACIR